MRTQTMLEARAIVGEIVRLPIPVIAAVNGPAAFKGEEVSMGSPEHAAAVAAARKK
jgi:enoyl-CoA hydratase/carnithine racemase